MAITKSYFGLWSNARSQDMADWLSEKLVPEYADSVVYTNSNVDVIKDDCTIFRIGIHISTIVPYIFWNSSLSTELGVIASNLSASSVYGFSCKNAFVLSAWKNTSSNRWQGSIIFTKDSDGNTVIIAPKTFIDTENGSPNYFSPFRVGCFDNSLEAAAPELTAGYTKWSCTTLTQFPVYRLDGSVAYTPNLFFCPTYEWDDYGKKVSFDGTDYLLLGKWIVKDEKPQMCKHKETPSYHR